VLRNCQPQGRGRSYGAWVSLVALMGILWTCGRERPHEPEAVASLHLTCSPVSRGVHCTLFALFREVGLCSLLIDAVPPAAVPNL
jgi:hypothetical protein